MANANAVRATITKAADGWYTLTVSIRKNGRSRVLIEKPAASIVDAETAAEEFTSRHGAPWHTVEVPLATVSTSTTLYPLRPTLAPRSV
jgi:hypothetical protein